MTVTNFLSEVKYPRNMRGKRYNLAAILRLIVAGLLCNCNSIASIARFKKFLSKKLLQNLGFYDGITPCYSTLTIMLRKMNPKDLHDAIVKVISGIKETKEFQEVHIDGKTLRGSKDLENRAIQVLTGFNNKTKSVISFEEILNKDENKAMLEILQKFDIRRATITADAAFDHSDICEEIIQQGADFAICLKGNEANLLRATEQAFSNSKQENVRTFEKDVEYNHGRIEQRKIEVIDMPWEYLNGHRHIKQLCRITRRREQKNKGNYTEETAYMITSLSSSASAEMLLDLNRKHWSCENNLNWVKDRVFMEDKSTIRKDNAPIVLSLLRSFVISIIATISTKITETREYYSHYKQSVYTLFCNLRL